MADIKVGRGVHSVTPSGHDEEKIAMRKMKRAQQKERQVEERDIKNNSQESEVVEKYFNQITAKALKESGGHEELGIRRESQEVLSEKLEAMRSTLRDGVSATEIKEMAYLNADEIGSFLEFIDADGKKKTEYEKLVKNLEQATEGEEEGLIDQGARIICKGNKAEIYLMLCYLYEDLARKNAREKLKERLKKIINAFERQESAYLFSFFSSENILKDSPVAGATSANMLDKMASISSGNMKLNSLRQSLQFIAQTLPDNEMYKMVSIFMKFQAKHLKKLSGGLESKEEIASILQQERNLIVLNSIYNQCKKLFKHLKTLTPINEKYADFMSHVITVIESSMVSLDGLQNMEKLIGINEITLEMNRSFVKNFYVMMEKLPQPIFFNDAMRDRLLDSLKNIMMNIDKAMEPKDKGLSFLNKRAQKKVQI